MKTHRPLFALAILMLPTLSLAADKIQEPARIKHRMIVVLQLPSKSGGAEVIRFPATFTAQGQSIGYNHDGHSIFVMFTVAEISPKEIDLNYRISVPRDAASAPILLESYTVFDVSDGKDTKSITVDGKDFVVLSLEKEK